MGGARSVSLNFMKVARIHQHGGPEALVYEDAPEPQIKANEILVRVRACALNHLDLFVRAGIPGMKFDMPHILGSDIAGEVVQAGELCDRVKPGWRVLLSPGLSCRQCEDSAMNTAPVLIGDKLGLYRISRFLRFRRQSGFRRSRQPLTARRRRLEKLGPPVVVRYTPEQCRI